MTVGCQLMTVGLVSSLLSYVGVKENCTKRCGSCSEADENASRSVCKSWRWAFERMASVRSHV